MNPAGEPEQVDATQRLDLEPREDGLVLRTLSVADAPRLAELEQQLFAQDTPWTQADFESDIPAPHNIYFGVGEPVHGHLVGYAGLGMRGPQSDPEFEILTIGTDPAYQRRGIGRMMMDYICFVADSYQAPVFLEVRVDNTPATDLYEAYGFEYLGIRRNYYRPSGADAHTMRRPVHSDNVNQEK